MDSFEDSCLLALGRLLVHREEFKKLGLEPPPDLEQAVLSHRRDQREYALRYLEWALSMLRWERLQRPLYLEAAYEARRRCLAVVTDEIIGGPELLFEQMLAVHDDAAALRRLVVPEALRQGKLLWRTLIRQGGFTSFLLSEVRASRKEGLELSERVRRLRAHPEVSWTVPMLKEQLHQLQQAGLLAPTIREHHRRVPSWAEGRSVPESRELRGMGFLLELERRWAVRLAPELNEWIRLEGEDGAVVTELAEVRRRKTDRSELEKREWKGRA